MKIVTELPDKREYFRLFESTGWDDDYKLSEDDVFQTLKNSWFHVFAHSKNKLVGCARVICDGYMHALILDMIVHPDHRLKGIGSELMDKVLNKCKEEKIRDIQLFCAEDEYGFYEKNGFRRRPDNAPGMEIKMEY